MKKEIIIKRAYNAANIIDYIFIPISIPCWVLDDWFTEKDDGYYYLSPMADKIKDLVLERLSSNSNYSVKRLYIKKTVRTVSNKIITLKVARDLIEHSRSLASLKCTPIIVKNTNYINGSKTFRIILGTNLVINGIDPSVDEIFTKLIQDEEKL